MSRTRCFLVSDLHGNGEQYRKLFAAVRDEAPDIVFMAGDLLPHRWTSMNSAEAFSSVTLAVGVEGLREALGDEAPRWFLILGNDDERAAETAFIEGDRAGWWEYLHRRETMVGSHRVVGYSHVPPTPFLLKDWERFDVGRFVDPGCVSPEEGYRTSPFDADEVRSKTIAEDLDALVADEPTENLILMAHSPPYRTALDRAGLDGQFVDHAPLDVHVGSIAMRRFIEAREPLLTLHGHIHESARITGRWRDRIGRTHCFTAAHDGPELALVRFDLEDLDGATRELI
jgi:Icc-related predicted phosphoesterase